MLSSSPCALLAPLALTLSTQLLAQSSVDQAPIDQAPVDQAPIDRAGPLPGNDALTARESRANTFTASHQDGAAVSIAPDAGTVVAWESRRQRGGYTGIYLQAFGADGAPAGEEQPLHAADGDCHQRGVALAHDGSSALFAAWEQSSADGSAVLARRVPDGAVQHLGGDTASAPSVTGLADGGAAVTWIEADSLRFVRLDEDGAVVGDITTFGHVMESATHVSAATLPSDELVVVWAAHSLDGFRPLGLRAQRFDTDGAPTGDLLRFDGGDAADSIEPRVASTSDGFVVTWMQREQTGYGVRAATFAADGTRRLEVDVAGADSWLSGATVQASADGGFVVAWNQDRIDPDRENRIDGTDSDVMLRRFAADGTAGGPAFRATFRGEGRQELAAAGNARPLASAADGRIAIAWAGDADLGDTKAAHVTWLAPGSSQIAAALETAEVRLIAVATEPEAAVRQIDSGSVEGITAERIVADPLDPPIFTGTLPQARGAEWLEDGTGFTAITNTGWTPPDTVAAAGPDHIAMFVNGGVGFFTKTGQRTFFTSLNSFLGVPSSTFVFDPRILFDENSGRWIAGAVEHEGSSRGYFTVAVSDDDDPNGNWFKYRLDVTPVVGTFFVDFPHLGVTEDAVYLTSNNFPNRRFRDNLIYILPKQPMLSGQNVTARWTLTSSTASVGTGAHFGPTAGPYFVNTSGSSAIRVWSIRDPLTNPQLVSRTLTVPSFSGPGRVPQQGTSNRLSAVDTRMSITMARNGRLWVCHNTNTPVVTRWYEINVGNWPASGTPTLVQRGIASAPGSNIFLPSIAVDVHGNALICAAKSSSSETPSIVYFWRNAGDPFGAMQGPVTVRTSPASYTSSARWGDYSSVQVDPRDQATFWLAHEFNSNTSDWATHVEPHRIQAPTFTADNTTINAATGGSVNFTLDNPGFENRSYLVLGSVSGTTPGLRLPGVGFLNLDLNLDSFSVTVLNQVGSPVFVDFARSLDANGRGTAQLNVPPLPGVSGVNLWFAYVHDNATGFDYASETIQITLQ